MADNVVYKVKFYRLVHIAIGNIYDVYIYNANNVIYVPDRNLYISVAFIFLSIRDVY